MVVAGLCRSRSRLIARLCGRLRGRSIEFRHAGVVAGLCRSRSRLIARLCGRLRGRSVEVRHRRCRSVEVGQVGVARLCSGLRSRSVEVRHRRCRSVEVGQVGVAGLCRRRSRLSRRCTVTRLLLSRRRTVIRLLLLDGAHVNPIHLLPPVNPLGVIAERKLFNGSDVLERRSRSVDARRVASVSVVHLLKVVLAAALQLVVVDGRPPQEPSLDGDKLCVSRLVERLECGDGSHHTIRAAYHDGCSLVRKFLEHVGDEVSVDGLHEHLVIHLTIPPLDGVDQRHVHASGHVSLFVLARRPDVEPLPVVGKQYSRFERRRNLVLREPRENVSTEPGFGVLRDTVLDCFCRYETHRARHQPGSHNVPRCDLPHTRTT